MQYTTYQLTTILLTGDPLFTMFIRYDILTIMKHSDGGFPMKRHVVVPLICLALIAGCSYFNKYGPYKLTLNGLDKAYAAATAELKKADTPEQVAKVFNTLAAMHEKTNPAIAEMWKQFPELLDPQSPAYPETLKETASGLKATTRGFISTVKNTPKINNMRDAKAMEAVQRWNRTMLELAKLNKEIKDAQQK